MKTVSIPAAAVAATLAVAPAPASAGPFADQLGRCMVRSMSEDDTIAVMRWFALSVTAHPSLDRDLSIPATTRDQATEAAGDLFERLLFKDCRQETREAVTNEGQAALFAAGGTMGEAAANRLFTHPKVAEQLDGLDRYLDEDEFRRLME